MSNRTRKSNGSGKLGSPNLTRWIFAFVALFVGIFVCVGTIIGGSFWAVNKTAPIFQSATDSGMTSTQSWASDSAELTVAVSPVMAPVFQQLVDAFNAQNQKTPDGKPMTVHVVTYEPEKMVSTALHTPEFQAMSPDSSLWLDRLEQSWSAQAETNGSDAQIPIGQRRIAEQTRYAVSPIVIAAWESAARELGWPDRPVGWEEIQRQATQNPNFKWNHPSTNNAAGLLATLAEFYAGAGLTRGLTEADATKQSTLDYVRAVEATVRFYGEGEDVIVQRLAQEGRNFLDAFVAQERVVLDWNKHHQGERLVALYPAEGTLWTDHPLALLELGSKEGETRVTDNQRLTFKALSSYLTGQEAQKKLLDAGYRPADLNISLETTGSPFAGSDAVDWRQPQTTLQMPSPAVVDVVQNFWYYAKRPTNVFLVADTSGSMEGVKMDRAREALISFVNQIKGTRDRVGLVEFGSGIKSYVPLTAMDDVNKAQLLNRLQAMESGGGTALIDAAYEAATEMIKANDTEAINAIVVMTDGQENESSRGLGDLQDLIASTPHPPIIFTIGFGEDADENVLSVMASIGGGQFRRADETDIQELYKTISTYF